MYAPRRYEVVAVRILVNRVEVVGVPWVVLRTRASRCGVAILERNVLDGAPVEDELACRNVDLLEPAVREVSGGGTSTTG